MVRHKRSSGLIWIDLLLSCVLDKHDITVLAASAEDQLFAIRRPVETDQSDSVEMCNLIQRAITDSEAPDVVAVLSTIDVCQLLPSGFQRMPAANETERGIGSIFRGVPAIDPYDRNTRPGNFCVLSWWSA